MTDLSEPNRLPERMAAVEAILPHLATKADLLALEVRMMTKIDALRVWMIGTFFMMLIGFSSLGVAFYSAING